MTNLCILSDTHNKIGCLDKILPILKESDYVIHLGDGLNDILFLKEILKNKFYYSLGNCDKNTTIPFSLIDIEDIRILYTHGHNFNVKSSLDNLINKAISEKSNIALFGHTHISHTEKIGDLTIINPGSLGYNQSYCYMSIHKNKLCYKINTLF